MVFGLSRPRIKPESTVSVADALFTQLLIGQEINLGSKTLFKIFFVVETGSSYDKESQARGDQADQVRFEEDHSPHLIIMFRSSKASHPVSNNRRQKRSLDADYCFRRNPSETNCCLRELFIDFRKDLGWNWIRAPSGYKANYCAGACPYLWSTDTQHSTILSLYHTMNPQASSAPCCTPKDLDPIVLMYYDRGRFKFTQLPNMVVISCNCN